MNYPKMIYLGGDLAGEYRIVGDKAEEAAAEEDGFFAHDRPKAALEGKPAGDEKSELFAKLDAAGIEYKKTWGIERLRTALEGKPE